METSGVTLEYLLDLEKQTNNIYNKLLNGIKNLFFIS